MSYTVAIDNICEQSVDKGYFDKILKTFFFKAFSESTMAPSCEGH